VTPERWQQVKDIFDGAVECSPTSRMAYIRERCGDDEEMRREVESLLASDKRTGSLLNNPLIEMGTGVSAPSDLGAASPVQNDSFGPYVPVRVLGEGGMGTVYLARQQQPIRREVALKVVKLGMDSRQVLERFEIERQALARMDYPNVARVLDAGTSERGRPYFVMEYVDGLPITQYCDGKTLSTRERLQLFILVCKALQHAHKKGIIHRDVKPSNVLVTEVDGKPVPKVIDFGVARATEQRSAERDVFTLSGQLIGTPEYMSPEQASLDSRDIDTGTDVYSLGVVLYELLVGVLPLDIKSLRKLALGEVLRAIRETPVPKPTARITQMGTAAEGLALRRKTDPGQLKRELAGDLDSIVMKAIEKDPHCRYASASEFAADIERYLMDEPVLAGPPDRVYRIRKFIVRYRLYVGAVVSILFCLLLGLAVSTAMYFKVQRQSDIARQQSYVANIAAADLHLRSNEIAKARHRLLSCPKDLRRWEWRHLFLKTDFSLATLYTLGDFDEERSGGYSHANTLPMTFSADGSRIYASTTHTLYSWDAATFLPTARWSGFGSILAVAPHAEKILSKVYTTREEETDHTLRIFDPLSRRLIATFPRHHDGVTAAAFSPDGSRVVTGDRLGVLFLWDAGSGRALRSLTRSAKGVIAVAFSQDGKRIVAAFSDNTVLLWDAATGVTVTTRGGVGDGGNIVALAFSPDSKRVAVSVDTSMRLFEASSGRLQLEINDFDWPIQSLAFTSDGTRILAGTEEGVVQIRNVDSGRPVANLVGHEFAVYAIAFHPGGQILTADPSTIRVWNPSSFAGVKTLLHPEGRLTSIALDPNGRFVASESPVSVRLWDTSSGRLLFVLRPGEWKTFGDRSITFSPDSTYLAFRSSLCTIKIWDIISGSQIRAFEGCAPRGMPWVPNWTPRSEVTLIAFSSDGRRLASESNDGISIWEVATGRLLSKIVLSDVERKQAHKPEVALNFVPDGRIATDTRDGMGQEPLPGPVVKVWHLESGKLLVATERSPGHPLGSPRGMSSQSAPVGASENFEWMWSREVVYSQDGIIAFHSAGRRVFGAFERHTGVSSALVDRSNLVQIWDADSGEPLLLLHGHREPIVSIALSADGSRLASGDIGGTVKVWDTQSAYDPEAESLVQSLFSKLYFAHDVTEKLRTDPGLSESIRKNALLLVQQQGEHDLSGHFQAAWQAAKAPGAGHVVYELALRRARVACELAPWDSEVFVVQGAVQYRLGAYRDAISSLLHATELRVRPSITNLAFQAMTYHALGKTDKARFALAEAKRLLESPDTTTAPLEEPERVVTEARSVVESVDR
jgi:WD40 repeat protein/serine/threonine protein kinase